MAFDWALMHDALGVCTLGCSLLVTSGSRHQRAHHMALLIGLPASRWSATSLCLTQLLVDRQYACSALEGICHSPVT